MKIGLSSEPQGSILVVTLLTSMIVGLAVGSYLMLVSSQNYSTLRSLAWNSVIPLAEAGIEEALTHLNDDTILASNNWTSQERNGRTVYRKRRDFASALGYFSVTISNSSSGAPVIFSQASTRSPLGAGQITRTIRVTTVPNGLFR